MPNHTTPEPINDAAEVDIMLVIPHFGPGGAQHVATLLLNHWHHAGIRLAALTLFPQPDTHELTPDIPRYQFLPATGRRRTVNALETAFFRVRDIRAPGSNMIRRPTTRTDASQPWLPSGPTERAMRIPSRIRATRISMWSARRIASLTACPMPMTKMGGYCRLIIRVRVRQTMWRRQTSDPIC